MCLVLYLSGMKKLLAKEIHSDSKDVRVFLESTQTRSLCHMTIQIPF